MIVNVVLGNLMNNKGGLNDETVARLNLASDMAKNHKTELTILCGWAYRSDCDLSLAEAMKRHFYKLNPRLASQSICQKFSRDTVGDAIFSRMYLDANIGEESEYKLNVVTSDYHRPRAQEIFEFVFGNNQCIELFTISGFKSKELEINENRSLDAFRKTFMDLPAGEIKPIFTRLQSEHPFYNGRSHPRIGSYQDIAKSLLCKGCDR